MRALLFSWRYKVLTIAVLSFCAAILLREAGFGHQGPQSTIHHPLA